LNEVKIELPLTQHGAMPILSVGYCEADAISRGRILRAGPGVGDGVYMWHGADVRVVGFWRAPKNRSKPVSVSLLPLFPATGPQMLTKAPSIGWSLALGAQGMAAGPLGTRFNVPLDADQRVEIAVQKAATGALRQRTASPGSGGIAELQSIRAAAADPSSILQFGVLNSRIALNSGIYFVALREEDREDTPDWSLLRVKSFKMTDQIDPSGDGILMSLSGAALPFDYIVLSVSPYLKTAA
jgi:hypothetical protein